jgi:hypothetical protein
MKILQIGRIDSNGLPTGWTFSRDTQDDPSKAIIQMDGDGNWIEERSLVTKAELEAIAESDVIPDKFWCHPR